MPNIIEVEGISKPKDKRIIDINNGLWLPLNIQVKNNNGEKLEFNDIDNKQCLVFLLGRAMSNEVHIKLHKIDDKSWRIKLKHIKETNVEEDLMINELIEDYSILHEELMKLYNHLNS